MSAVHWEPNIRLIEVTRLRRCWTLRRLSREARLSYPTVINLLLGRTRPNFATLDQLGGALGIPAVDLITILPNASESRTDRDSAPSDVEERPLL